MLSAEKWLRAVNLLFHFPVKHDLLYLVFPHNTISLYSRPIKIVFQCKLVYIFVKLNWIIFFCNELILHNVFSQRNSKGCLLLLLFSLLLKKYFFFLLRQEKIQWAEKENIWHMNVIFKEKSFIKKFKITFLRLLLIYELILICKTIF